MKVEFLSKFNRDLDTISSKSLKKAVLNIILQVEAAKSLSEIPNTKKLSGHKSAFRIRIGNYRMGIFLETDIVQFARIVHRKDIYQDFPEPSIHIIDWLPE